MSIVLQISDPHFGTEQAPVVAALKALVGQRRPDAIILSGDITQRARRHQFTAARHFVDSLGRIPLLALPGNHDIPLYNVFARMFRPYAGYLRVFGPGLEPVLQTEELLIIGVNTTRPARHKNGEVSAQQVDRVVRLLGAARPRQLRIVVTHQPVAVFRHADEHDRLRGAEAAVAAWSQAGADLVLGGHIHLPYVIDLMSAHPPAPRRTWAVQAGTAVSHRIRHATCNSVNLIHWHAREPGEARRCRVERCDYEAQARAFVTESNLELQLQAR